MAIYSFWIYDRHTRCIFHRDYSHAQAAVDGKRLPGKVNDSNTNDESKLLFGMLFSLRKISNSLTKSPVDSSKMKDDFSNSLQLDNENRLVSLSTLNYKIQMFETLTGVKFVVVSDSACRSLQKELEKIYRDVWVTGLVENGMACVEYREDEFVEGPDVLQRIDGIWKACGDFSV